MQRRTVGRGQGKGQTIDFDRQDQLFHSSCLSGTVQRRMSTSTAEREREREREREKRNLSILVGLGISTIGHVDFLHRRKEDPKRKISYSL